MSTVRVTQLHNGISCRQKQSIGREIKLSQRPEITFCTGAKAVGFVPSEQKLTNHAMARGDKNPQFLVLTLDITRDNTR